MMKQINLDHCGSIYSLNVEFQIERIWRQI